VQDPDAVDLAEVGAWIDQQFPEGINVEFVPPAPGADRTDVEMRVWERGAGATPACGTGACAVASVLRDWDADGPVGHDRAITVHMPGGDADVVLRDDGTLVLCGDVHHIATVELPDG
ncbi:MAG TPA: hypothetical protein VMU14_00880, partial [Acidimicrobiales bacterium]|nr:hypothetical protein [Acidimicrobiales bacterium]